MNRASIPIVTYALARPFAQALERQHHPVEPVIQSVGLDPEMRMDDDVFIAAQNWYDFADAAAAALSDPCLGYSIGSEAALDTLPNLQVLELANATLGELLTALVIDVQRFSTIARYSLSTDGIHASLTTQRTFRPRTPPAQIDGYFAGFMVRILTLCTGNRWTPSDFEIRVCDPTALPVQVQKTCQVMRIGTEGASFRFPAQWMLLRTDGVVRQARLTEIRANVDFVDTFRTMLDLHLDRQGLSLALFASLTGQSKATLKRRLHSHGTTYQTELDKRRAARAAFLLQATSMPTAEIGARVGYPDPPSFSRAFRRWMSATPAQFRRARTSPEPQAAADEASQPTGSRNPSKNPASSS